MFFLLSAAVLIGACSDTDPATAPTTEPDPSLSQQSAAKQLRGEAKVATGLERNGVDAQHSPLLCNSGGWECLRVFHNGTYIQRVFHRGIAAGNGCSRSVIRIRGQVRGISNLVCHSRGDALIANWSVQEFHSFGTRIQVDFTGAGSASPRRFVYTNYR